jgi:hypothetical protein
MLTYAHTSAYAYAYVSIREHAWRHKAHALRTTDLLISTTQLFITESGATTVYMRPVSIRQHTSAYVSAC